MTRELQEQSEVSSSNKKEDMILSRLASIEELLSKLADK